jgi:hypothetical protein
VSVWGFFRLIFPYFVLLIGIGHGILGLGYLQGLPTGGLCTGVMYGGVYVHVWVVSGEWGWVDSMAGH